MPQKSEYEIWYTEHVKTLSQTSLKTHISWLARLIEKSQIEEERVDLDELVGAMKLLNDTFPAKPRES